MVQLLNCRSDSYWHRSKPRGFHSYFLGSEMPACARNGLVRGHICLTVDDTYTGRARSGFLRARVRYSCPRWTLIPIPSSKQHGVLGLVVLQ